MAGTDHVPLVTCPRQDRNDWNSLSMALTAEEPPTTFGVN